MYSLSTCCKPLSVCYFSILLLFQINIPRDNNFDIWQIKKLNMVFITLFQKKLVILCFDSINPDIKHSIQLNIRQKLCRPFLKESLFCFIEKNSSEHKPIIYFSKNVIQLCVVFLSILNVIFIKQKNEKKTCFKTMYMCIMWCVTEQSLY